MYLKCWFKVLCDEIKCNQRTKFHLISFMDEAILFLIKKQE